MLVLLASAWSLRTSCARLLIVAPNLAQDEFRLIATIFNLEKNAALDEKGSTIKDIRQRLSGRARNEDNEHSDKLKCFVMSDYQLGARWRDIGEAKPKIGKELRQSPTIARLLGHARDTRLQQRKHARVIEVSMEQASGMRWEKTASPGDHVHERSILVNETLASILAGKGLGSSAALTREEWEACDVRELRMDHLIDIGYRLNPREWANVGLKRPHGARLENAPLAGALKRGQTRFTQGEWDSFGISRLMHGDHIEVEGEIFQPKPAYFRPAELNRDLLREMHALEDDAYMWVGGTYYRTQMGQSSRLENRLIEIAKSEGGSFYNFVVTGDSRPVGDREENTFTVREKGTIGAKGQSKHTLSQLALNFEEFKWLMQIVCEKHLAGLSTGEFARLAFLEKAVDIGTYDKQTQQFTVGEDDVERFRDLAQRQHHHHGNHRHKERRRIAPKVSSTLLWGDIWTDLTGESIARNAKPMRQKQAYPPALPDWLTYKSGTSAASSVSKEDQGLADQDTHVDNPNLVQVIVRAVAEQETHSCLYFCTICVHIN